MSYWPWAIATINKELQQGSSIYSSPIAVDSQVVSRWGIDLIGPLKETKNGNRYVIVAVEYLTKSPELGALPS